LLVISTEIAFPESLDRLSLFNDCSVTGEVVID
jgi:hypothetical protein